MVEFQMAARRPFGAWGCLNILRWAGSQSWERRSWLPHEAHAGFEVSAHSQVVDLRWL